MAKIKKINKRQARKLWDKGKPFWMCPCKMLAFGPWHMEMLVDAKTIEQYKRENPDGDGFEAMYNTWAVHNTDYERGYYAHFYVKVKGGKHDRTESSAGNH